MATSDDLMTFIAPANRRVAIYEVHLTGMGTTSAAGEVRVARSTGGTTGGGALTAEPLDPDSVAAGSTVNSTWSTQPTIGNVMLRLGVNQNGALNRWVARPGSEIVLRNAGQISIRPAVGTHSISIHVLFEEW
jgi:hypothetical protein